MACQVDITPTDLEALEAIADRRTRIAIVRLIDALVEAGIRAFDVASIPEIERLAGVPDRELFFMNPIKSRNAIVASARPVWTG